MKILNQLLVILVFGVITNGCHEQTSPSNLHSNRIHMLGDSLFGWRANMLDSLYHEQKENLRFYQRREINFSTKERIWGRGAIDKRQLLEYASLINYPIIPINILDQRMYRCEDDILRSDANVLSFVYHRLEMAWEDSIRQKNKGGTENKLVVFEDIETKKLIRWDESTEIRYCVDNTFSDDEREKIILAMSTAMKDWNAVASGRCPKFKEMAYLHRRSHTALSKDKVDFVVTKGSGSENRFYASAFFPDERSFEKRFIVIGVPFFEKPDSVQAGICRHEMGHILGLLHEHIYNNGNDCNGETIPGRPRHFTCAQSEVDLYSVMHYLCGKGGKETMTISPCDVDGVNYFYNLVQAASPPQ